MNKSEYVSTRLSPVRSKQLDELCSKTGDKRGAVARKALEQYLDSVNQGKVESLQEMSARVTEMDLKLDVIIKQQSKKRWW